MYVCLFVCLSDCDCDCVCVCVCVCVSLGLYMQECRYLFRPEEGIRFPAARVTGGYELPNMGLGN